MRWLRSSRREKLATERLEDRLKAQSLQIDGLESSVRKLELEWIETYDKIRHQLSRMAKRGDLAKGPGNGEIPAPEDAQDAGMDPISAAIHARRNRPFLGRQ